MKRDCGKGDLIPIGFKLIWCVGTADREWTQSIGLDLDAAIAAFESKIAATTAPYSNVRLYAEDREGYRNCILSSYRDKFGGQHLGENRIHELSDAL